MCLKPISDMVTAVLSCQNLSCAYGPVQVLHEVSLEVAEGEIVALLGANGAGKTTTLRTVSGLNRLYRGAISLAGQRIEALPAYKICALGIGHVPEGRRIFPRMSVDENLDMGAYLIRGERTKDKKRIFELFPVLADRRK